MEVLKSRKTIAKEKVTLHKPAVWKGVGTAGLKICPRHTTNDNLEKLNDPTVISAFQATIGGRFAPLATLVDEDADLDSMVTHFNKAVTDTAAELLGKQRRKRKPWVIPEILDLCDQRRPEEKERRARRSQRL